MDAAERRIREAGYSGFSYREIAVDVGVKAASVHYHFPSKDTLAAAVAHRYNDRVLEAVEAGMASGLDAIQAWRAVFRDALRDGPRMCLCGALGAASADLPPGVMVEVHRFFRSGLDSLRKAGLSEDRATQVMAVLEGAILMATAQSDPEIFDRATAALD
nr:TetR/AcrR family transcriptional regulator [Methylobacterium brachythecii]